MGSIDANNTVDFSTIDPNIWKNNDAVEKLVDRLRTATKIITKEDNTTHEYTRQNWTKFQEILAMNSQNPMKAKILCEAFNKAFADMPEGSAKEKIKTFIEKNQIFIGFRKPKFNFANSSISNLVDAKFTGRFEQFLDLVSKAMQKHYSKEKIEKNTNKTAVAILTCNSGGGHRMVATAMEQLLKEPQYREKYDATVINIDEEGDPLNIVTNGAIKSSHIYWKFRVQENDIRKEAVFNDLKTALHQFIPSNALDRVNLKIQQFGADLLLNTIHHEITGFAHCPDIGIPMAFVNTDFELPAQLLELRENIQTDNLKILTPIDYQLKGVEGVVPMGYPIRTGFETRITPEAAAEIRRKYTSKDPNSSPQDNEWLIVVQMGSLAGKMVKAMPTLTALTKNLKKKCHFVFLCGDNQKLKDTVLNAANEIRSKDPKHPQNGFFHPEDLLNDYQLGALYQSCDAVLGKPGGSTTAEIAATGAFLFSYDPFLWETPNQEYLEKRNQSMEIGDLNDLVKFISKNDKIRTQTKPETLNWKENLIRVIDDTVKNKNIDKSNTNTAAEDNSEIRVNTPYSNSKWRQLFKRYCSRAFKSITAFFKFIMYLAKLLMQEPISAHMLRLRRWWKYS